MAFALRWHHEWEFCLKVAYEMQNDDDDDDGISGGSARGHETAPAAAKHVKELAPSETS
jgi:hypothetical protein